MKPIYKIIIGIICSSVFLFGTGFPPYYYQLKDKAQKVEFINILKPMIDRNNQQCLDDRAFIVDFFNKSLVGGFRSTSSSDLKRLLKISKRYRIKSLYDREQYLEKVDAIPVSLALVQGAIESGWGKSRFVREANNIFGHWTWGEVGIIPLNREEGKTHKIRIFYSLQSSVNAYALNLNRHDAYKSFRKVRSKKREEGRFITGNEAADTMIYYSELREKYVDILHKMIKKHRLSSYDIVGGL